MIQYIKPDSIDWSRFVEVELGVGGSGETIFRRATHFTFVPSTVPHRPAEEGWEDVVYLRRVAPVRTDASSKNGSGGFVYILTNEAHPGVCKIGFTTNQPGRRLQEINNAGTMIDWDVLYSFRCERPYDLEQAIHQELEHLRIRDDREFFDINVREAIEVVEEMGKDYGPF